MGRAGLGRAAETSWAVFVLGVFLFSWFSRQRTWEVVGPEPDPPHYGTGGVTVEEAGVPEPGALKESCSSVMQKLLPHFTEEETEAQRGPRTCPGAPYPTPEAPSPTYTLTSLTPGTSDFLS